MDNKRLIGQEFKREMGERVVQHRNTFARFFKSRFVESLTTLFNYNIETPFDRNVLEYGLRYGYGMVIGKNALQQDVVLGYIRNNVGSGAINNNFDNIFKKKIYRKSDITFTIPEYLIPQGKMREIYYYDKGAIGEFVVMWNKPIELTNDFEVIQHYTNSLAEIVASRYSLNIQAKAMTVGVGEPGDESVNQFFAAALNGQPVATVDKFFDPDENIVKFDNTGLANNLAELKIEYQNIIAELNAIFGINILAVNKNSGVTDSEANGNLSFVNNNLAIWLKSRQQALDLYNARYGTDYTVSMSDAEQGTLIKQDDGSGELSDENNNATN